MSMRQPLLSVEDLHVRFWTRRGTIHAVNGISFDIAPGETLGIVGESGCGKSVTSLAILGILPRAGRATEGRAIFDGRDLLQLSDSELRRVRGKEIAMIFQDPMTSLNPVLTIGRQITEALETHFGMKGKVAEQRAAELLDRVGIPAANKRVRDYPHQFSGGMRQRAMIAMALACKPKLMIADEPTTALDVTIQAQILDLLRELVAEENAALILITHDLGVVAGMCERVNVMYAGLFMETGTAGQLFGRPRHPYTVGLLQSIPRLDAAKRERLHPIEGTPRDMLSPPQACPFQPRCRYEVEQSRQAVPPLEQIEPGHKVACFNPVPVEEWERMKTAVISS
jgi:oligopeptide/dipeptide ABC transporter ATP-binding protein